MKTNRHIWSLSVCSVLTLGSLYGQSSSAQDSTGLPGDNFSLEGALELFKKSESPEQFERMLNSEDNKVNNLDLNGDGETDYIKVIDKNDGDAHAFVLQAAVSESESQDVAVIELEKNGSDDAVVQIVGDEDIYGEQIIVEPAPDQVQSSRSNVVVNVWAWPTVRYVYRPAYVVWVSPWGWRAHPGWWRPWRPMRWHAFYPYRAPYRHHYVVVHTHRVVHAHRVYAPVRTTSVTVHNRNRSTVTHYRSTRTVSPSRDRNNSRVRTTTRKTTTVQDRKGSTRTRATKVRKRGG